MKEFYHNKAGRNTAIVKCKNQNSVFDLYYHLYDNPVQHIWQNIHIDHHGIRTSNLSAVSITDLSGELKNCCQKVGIFDFPEKFTQAYLNELHNKFVSSDLNSVWNKINDLIHIIESKINNHFMDYDSTITFYSKQEQFIPIKEEYKIFLNTDITWGRMNLGYGTLGKDWIDISKNNDTTDDLALQTTISSETNLVFCVEPGVPGVDEVRFYNWAQSKERIPMGNLNNLSIGRYPLGQLIITDNLLEFHNNASDWYVPNHRCKLQWNKEVFNSFVEIIEINFADTDLLYNSFVNHSNVKGLLNV